MGGASLSISGQPSFPRGAIEAPCLYEKYLSGLPPDSYVVVKDQVYWLGANFI